MPISEYYKGHGRKVMSDMKRRYGPDKGESVFYATAAAKRELSRPNKPKVKKNKNA